MAPTKTATKTSATKPKSAHPSFQDMVKECIIANPDAVRIGVSRPTIKKFMADKYKLDMSSKSNLNNLANAIKKGSETKVFDLPKGIGGHVKLVKKVSAAKSAGKENAPPVKAAAAKPKAAAAAATKPAAKPVAKKVAAKPAAKAAAKPAAKAAAKPAAKAPVKKAAPAAKKTSVVKKPAAKAAAAKPKAKAPVSKAKAKPVSKK